MILAAGVVAASFLARKAPAARSEIATGTGSNRNRFVLQKDVPELGLRRGELLRIDPEALVYVGDVVALRDAHDEVVLARFHDELMHCTAGLVVKESNAVAAY